MGTHPLRSAIRFQWPRTSHVAGLACAGIVAGLLWVLNNYLPLREAARLRRDQQTAAELEKLGASVFWSAEVSPHVTGVALTKPLADWTRLRGFARLQRIDFGGSDFTEDDFSSIGQLVQLEVVACHDVNVPDEALRHLWQLRRLKSFRCFRTQFTDAGLRHLSALPELQNLHLSSTPVRGNGLLALHGNQQLTTLSLEKSLLSDIEMSDVVTLKRLKHLSIRGARVTGIGIEKLSRLPNLETLTISGTLVDDAAMKQLTMLPSLGFLNIGSTSVGDKGLMNLAVGAKRLEWVHVKGSRVTHAGVDEVLRQYPGLRIDGP